MSTPANSPRSPSSDSPRSPAYSPVLEEDGWTESLRALVRHPVKQSSPSAGRSEQRVILRDFIKQISCPQIASRGKS